MRNLARILPALCIWLALPAFALDITTEDNPPFNYLDGQRVTGMSTEILTEMGRRAGVPLTIHMQPWARAYQAALEMPDTCVYSTVRLPEREALFKWIGPLATNKWALFAKNDFSGQIRSIDDAKNYRIGGITLDAKAMYLKSLGFPHVDMVADEQLNLAKLLSGHIDLWISGLYKQSADSVDSKAIKPVLVVREVDYFLACHPRTSEATLNALTRTLQALRKEGYLKAVTERYAGSMR